MRALPIITIETVLARHPCWPGAKSKLLAFNQEFARSEWTALEVLSLDDVPVEERFWVCLHDSALPSAVLRRFAVEVAADAMRLTGWTDARSWAALDAALAYERGEIRAAWDATQNAARAARAARVAAWAAAWAVRRAWRAASDAQICMLRQITLLWCDGYDILAGGPWERKARAA